MCPYEDCGLPDAMYETSDELFRHVKDRHSVLQWVCDYRSPKSENCSFVASNQEEWEMHLHTKHEGTFSVAQLPSLATVSQRTMLKALSCPLCGYATETASPTIDDHILHHLHGFSLRCLPWGSSGREADTVFGQSVAGPDSEDLTADENDDGDNDVVQVYVDFSDVESLGKLFDEAAAKALHVIDKAQPQARSTIPSLRILPRGHRISLAITTFREYLDIFPTTHREAWGPHIFKACQVLEQIRVAWQKPESLRLIMDNAEEVLDQLLDDCSTFCDDTEGKSISSHSTPYLLEQ